MASARKSRVRPYLVRPGARYRCFGDGLCCSDMHAIGPLDHKAVVTLSVIAPEALCFSEAHDAHVLMMREGDGTCVFLADGLCQLHATMGGELKPSPCVRFPFGLVATPSGGRITTDHRCACRTLGDRPPIDLDEALMSVREGTDRARADHRVEDRVRIDARRTVAFDAWERLESALQSDLAAGRPAADVLGVEPFPALADRSWEHLAHELRTIENSTRIEAASAWFGDAIRTHLGQRSPARPRPWADGYARAEARTPEPESPDAIVNDWVADEIWGMRWTDAGTFERARLELATRVYVATQIAKRLRRKGIRADVATAEAVMVVELVGSSDWWARVVAEMPE
jgi:hypothetical protein